MSTPRNAPQHPNNGDGESLFVMGYDEHTAYQSIARQLTRQVEPTPEPGSDREDEEQGGVIRRSNEFRSQLGPVMLESVGLAGMEIAKANARRARDLYRNKFPLLVPAFEAKCTECELAYEEELDAEECPDCGGDLRPPDEEQRAWADAFFEEVNKEGQSLSELYQSLATDAGRLGGWTHVVRYNYGVLNGEVLQEPVELVRADPKRLKPVVDEDHRIGGYWWACPIHREPFRESGAADVEGRCPECHAELREVFFAEVDTINYRGRATEGKPEKVYFEEEVVDFAAFNERLSGHDWLSPVEHLWKRQAILEWMNTYAGAFFDDQNTERYPGRILMLHTSNRDLVEKQLSEAADDREADPYKNGVLYNVLPRDGGGQSDQAQVLDMASDEIIGQSPDLKKDFKSDIRNVYGQADVQDSELEDASGLNNEGLELSVRNDAIASWHTELKVGPLSKLTRVLGLTDWNINFVPPEEPREETKPEDIVQAVATAEQAGIPYEIADGRFMLADTDGVVEPEGETPAPEGGPEAFGGRDTGNGRPTPASETTEVDVGLAEEAVRRAVRELGSDGAREATRFIEAAYDGMWGEDDDGLSKQATPTVSSERDVPEFAQELLDDAIQGGAVVKPEAMSSAELPLFEAVLRRNLVTQGQWTVNGVATDVANTLNVERDTARTWAVNGVQNVVQSALELGYMIEGDLDDRRFYMGGPMRQSTCEACQSVLERTNPSFGGEPLPLDEFRDFAENAAEQHDIGEEFVTGGSLHPNCRHRLTEARGAS